MKTKNIYFASRLASLVLAVFTLSLLAACGNDSAEESPIKENLSEETTPITFNLPKESTILFDYAGKTLIWSDTIPDKDSRWKGYNTFNLRQGKHTLIWFTGLDQTYEDEVKSKNGTWSYNHQIHFDPKTMSVSCNPWNLGLRGEEVKVCKKELTVYPYLMPEQNLVFEDLTTEVNIVVTDEIKLDESYFTIGYMVGMPIVKSIGLSDGKYTLYSDTREKAIYPDIWLQNESSTGGYYRVNVELTDFLCPSNGINNIQLEPMIVDRNGNKINIHTTRIPKFSVRRGYTTILRGPLFSGSTSDWTVEMQPYE